MIPITDCRSGLPERRSRVPRHAPKQREAVVEIISNVAERGDEALFEYTKEFDHLDLSQEGFKISDAEWEAGIAKVDPVLYKSLQRSADNIATFHKKMMQQSWLDVQKHTALGQLILPLEKVGVYVPGGTAAYPSTVLMTTIPARIAGVDQIVMCTPAQPDGSVLPLTLAAAKLAGVDAIYRVGGAQAIAAMAYGTETIPRVDKVAGPGNIYVALAKREVFGYVGIDMIAGPSEIMVVADDGARAEFVAADMLSQAEHDVLSAAMLVTDSEQMAEQVRMQLTLQVPKLPRAELIEQALSNCGRIYLVEDLEQGMELVNRIAPEHVELCVRDPFSLLGKVRNAGAVFLGDYSPEPLGDYFAGPDHVLPTSGTARYFSALGVQQFMKRTSIIQYDKHALKDAYKDIERFALAEGLAAHARAATIRFEEE